MKFLLLCSLLGFTASQTTPNPGDACGPAINGCQYGTFEYNGECYPEAGKTCFSTPDGFPCDACDDSLNCATGQACYRTFFGNLCYPNLGGACPTQAPPSGTPECGPCNDNPCLPGSYCFDGTCYATYADQGCPML